MPDYRRNYEDELRREGRRGWADRADDEVRSWFADDDPRQRRGNDERDDRYPYGGDRNRGWRDQGDGSYERGVERWRGTERGSERRHVGGRDYERERYGAVPGWHADRTDDRGWSRSDADDWESGFGRRERWPERELEWDERHRMGGRSPYGGALGGYRGRWQGGAREFEDYSGRGPKDYRRSDERIREEVSDRLTDDYSVDASDISIHVKDGEVTLSGTVTTRDQKRRAEDLAEATSGVREVTNSLRVTRTLPAGLGVTRPGTTPVGTEDQTAGDRQQPSASSGRRPGSTQS